MKILNIMLIILVFALVGILLFFIGTSITGQGIINKYSFTKAICDENNYCQDYEIVCENHEVKSISFTGQAVQFSEDWKDSRIEEQIGALCD